MDGWMGDEMGNGWKDDIWLVGWMDGGCMYVCLCGWMDGWMDDDWIDG